MNQFCNIAHNKIQDHQITLKMIPKLTPSLPRSSEREGEAEGGGEFIKRLLVKKL